MYFLIQQRYTKYIILFWINYSLKKGIIFNKWIKWINIYNKRKEKEKKRKEKKREEKKREEKKRKEERKKRKEKRKINDKNISNTI
jgi:uncharacterized membrane-anchored protein